MCIDLVFSYSIDATNCLFTESDALRSRFFLPDPLPWAGVESAGLACCGVRDGTLVSCVTVADDIL